MTDLSYRASLKNPAVEEPIDLLLHRPLGYVVARLAYPTSITPDAITLASMVVGIASGITVALSFSPQNAGRLPIAAALLIGSAVLDCSDGQLARMRKSSSRMGRMLDGAVDAVVQIAVVPLAILQMFVRLGGLSSWTAWAWSVAAVMAILVGVRHTTLYDQYKNVWVRNTDLNARDCDDEEDLQDELAEAKAKGPLSLLNLLRFSLYATHLTLVRQTMAVMDPAVPARFRDMPHVSEDSARRYRVANKALMRAWSFFGIGTHIFLLACCVALNSLETYVVLRLVVFNLALIPLVILQRKSSTVYFGPAAPRARK
ncbi:MAG: CDP-alcohol phosphatidyltransferase family protein [Deltaproteobacteria bacterium]|nr:CDP-alcohol phosphatidyltransferase family protein [Deltaproteobacteria bacterium]